MSFAMEGDIIIAESQPLWDLQVRRVIESLYGNSYRIISKRLNFCRVRLLWMGLSSGEMRSNNRRLDSLHGGKY